MIANRKHRAVFVATLNNEQLIVVTRKNYMHTLEIFIRDVTFAYGISVPPMSLKNYVIEQLKYLGDDRFEILGDSTIKQYYSVI